jgi:hypothetical protein
MGQVSDERSADECSHRRGAELPSFASPIARHFGASTRAHVLTRRRVASLRCHSDGARILVVTDIIKVRQNIAVKRASTEPSRPHSKPVRIRLPVRATHLTSFMNSPSCPRSHRTNGIRFTPGIAQVLANGNTTSPRLPEEIMACYMFSPPQKMCSQPTSKGPLCAAWRLAVFSTHPPIGDSCAHVVFTPASSASLLP